jgi:hypothetical protein
MVRIRSIAFILGSTIFPEVLHPVMVESKIDLTINVFAVNADIFIIPPGLLA